MMLRALRWGELRAQAPEPDPRLLVAPPPTSRMQLRTLMLDAKWPDLLEAAEMTMASTAGRGWLDLQRYALRAVDELGAEYAAVGSAIRSELRALLREVPTLVDMTIDGRSPDLRARHAELAPGRVRRWRARGSGDCGGGLRQRGARRSNGWQRRSGSQLPARVRRGTGGPTAEGHRAPVPRARSRKEPARADSSARRSSPASWWIPASRPSLDPFSTRCCSAWRRIASRNGRRVRSWHSHWPRSITVSRKRAKTRRDNSSSISRSVASIQCRRSSFGPRS